MHTAFFPLKAEFTDEEISERAYALWLKRGKPKGYESEIWREAKAELQSESWLKTKRRRFFRSKLSSARQLLRGDGLALSPIRVSRG